MMLSIIQNKKFILLFAIIVISLFLYSFFPKPPTPPTFESSIPQNNAKDFSTIGSIILKFNSNVTSDDFSITSIPESTWIVGQQSNKQIYIKPVTQLQRVTPYSLKINWKNQTLHTFNLTTEDTQTDYEVINKVKSEIAKNYPLAAKVPYEQPGFKVQYQKELTLEILLKTSVEDRAEIINSVRDWVKESGLDPDSHAYVFSN